MHVPMYILWLIKEIIVSGVQTALSAFGRSPMVTPVIIYYPLRVTSEWLMFWFSTSVTATPGTLALGFREPANETAPRTMIVQALQGSDPASVMADLADMEERLAPEVRAIDHGVPGQGPTEVLDEQFYEYLSTSGKGAQQK